MLDLTIVLAVDDIACFRVGGDIFYFVDDPNVPYILNAGLGQQLIPNLDLWFQAQTHQRHGLRSVRDMIAAFKAGMNAAYSGDSVLHLCAEVVKATIKACFRAGHAPEYCNIYWVEALSPTKIGSTYNKSIRDKFEHYRTTIGDDKLYSDLCRLWHHCQLANNSDATTVIEGLIKRLGRMPQTPTYPDTTKQDTELIQHVFKQLLSAGFTKYRHVPSVVLEQFNDLQARRQ